MGKVTNRVPRSRIDEWCRDAPRDLSGEEHCIDEAAPRGRVDQSATNSSSGACALKRRFIKSIGRFAGVPGIVLGRTRLCHHQ